MKIKRNLSPNYTVKTRQKNKIKFVIIHYTGMQSEIESIKRLKNPKSKVSCHYLINRKGKIIQLVKDKNIAWHAGKSNFNGRTNCNGFLLGLSFSGNTNARELTDDEVSSAIEWLVPRFEKWGWPKDLSTVTTHRDISPGRKDDIDSKAEAKLRSALTAALNK